MHFLPTFEDFVLLLLLLLLPLLSVSLQREPELLNEIIQLPDLLLGRRRRCR